jgi:hypothetical protein
VRAAAVQGELLFRSAATGEPTPVPYDERLITVLLSSYVHMTDNRLGTSPGQEAYLSYLIERALEPAPWPQGDLRAPGGASRRM